MGKAEVVVTGVLGFVGHNLALYLAARGYRVIGIDNYSRPSPRAPRILEEHGIDVLKADVREHDAVLQVLRGAEAVVHAAALVSVSESMEKPELYALNNVVGTVSLLRTSIDAGVRRIIYLSSASVYGEPSYLPVDEAHPLKPLSPYGASKLAGEIYVEAWRRGYGAPSYIILRLFNVYGPGQDPSSPYSGVISRFVSRVCRGEPPVIYGDGRQTRDFVHVDDVARAVELALETGAVDTVYNIASGKPVSIGRLAEITLRAAGRSDLRPVYASPRPGDIRESYASIEKASRILGFRPRVELEEGIKRLVEELCVEPDSTLSAGSPGSRDTVV